MTDAPRSWLRRLFEAGGLPPAAVGMGIFAVIAAAFGIQELALGRFSAIADEPYLVNDMGLSIAHLVMVVYCATAIVYYERVWDREVQALREAFPRSAIDGARPGPLLMATAGGVGLVGAVIIVLYFSPGSTSYDPSTWSPENGWHRVLSPLIGLTVVPLWCLTAFGAARISEMASRLEEIDLLCSEQVAPFARLGLNGALLVIGSIAAFSLFLVDTEHLALVVSIGVTTLCLGALALLVPLRGVRDRVRIAKQVELDWCRERMHTARNELAAGRSSDDLEQLIAWESRVAAVPEWPVDSSTLTRFALYLLIPLGSWAGAAIVERFIDTLLD